jgi:hypothetical protein
MRSQWTLVLLLLAAADLAVGATISVRQDGTGDYAALQPAFDAVAEGDTVLVGPGEYTEYTLVRLPGATEDLEVYGHVQVRELTIIGSGMGVTVIGPVQYVWTFTGNPQGLRLAGSDHDLHLSDLTIRNCYSGVSVGGTVSAQRCELGSCDFGIFSTYSGAGSTITNCIFAGGDLFAPRGIGVLGGGSDLLVEDCSFDNACPYVTNAETTFRRCRMSRGVVGLSVVSGAACHVWDCDIAEVQYGLQTALGWPGSSCDVHNSRIDGTVTALYVEQHTSVAAEGSVLTGGSNSVIWASDADALNIHGCDLVKGAGPVVRCTRPAVLGSVTYDLTGNYWGTTDEAEIQSWIIDGNDDASIWATVLYSPFAGQSVPTESMTWGDVKALYR